jgi:hypothetical protein
VKEINLSVRESLAKKELEKEDDHKSKDLQEEIKKSK